MKLFYNISFISENKNELALEHELFGNDTIELKATKEAYEGVHPCCKYRDDDSDDSEKHHE